MELKFTLNGEKRQIDVEPRKLLIDVLRDDFGLTSVHSGCDTAMCGACTVLVDGKPVKSCNLLAMQVQDSEVQTLEGLSNEHRMKILKKSFLKNHGLQCGFCTSGMLISSFYLLKKGRESDDDEIREAIEGNICRCTGYVSIVKSIREADDILNKTSLEELEMKGEGR